jgi:hypothetical protein
MTTTSEPLVIRKRRSAPRAVATPAPVPAPIGSSEPKPAPPSRARTPRRLTRRRPRIWTTANQLAAAILFWAALAWVVFAQDPDDAAARGAFFAVLLGALFFTLAPLIRAVSLQFAHSRLYQEALTVHAARQALMVSAFVVLNGLLQMQRAWNGLTALLLFSVFAIIEIVALARR